MFRTVFSMPLFNFDTLRQVREKDRRISGRMFPFGEKQQEWEERIIGELFPKAKKIERQQIRFEVLTRREVFVNAALERGDADYRDLPAGLEKWEEEIRHTPLTEEQIRIVIAMAELENAAPDMESLPTAERIRERAEELARFRDG